MEELIKNKIELYEKCIITLLKEHYDYRNQNDDTLLIIDKESRNYLIIENDWANGIYFHAILIHFRIVKEGKVWLLGNYIDNEEVIPDLIKLGVAKEDIILRMKPENAMPHI